ncbi:MAG: 3'-5' exonuclease [Polyangiaceae bacterium]|nr:3'-5' exonuclease [Polyangiaceae bacterium]
MSARGEICGCFPTGRHYAGIAHLLRLRVLGAADEVPADAAWADQLVVCIDTETTGRDPAVDRIVEIGLIVGRGGEIVARHGWLVNPERAIPEEVSKIHGITDDAVRDQPPFRDLVKPVLLALEGALPVAYNARFDRAFLHEEMRRAGVEVGPSGPPALRTSVDWIDPLVWARLLHKEEKSRALGDVAARLGVALDNAHRATDDAEAALRVLYAFGLDPRVPRAYGSLVQEQRRLARQQEEEARAWRDRS